MCYTFTISDLVATWGNQTQKREVASPESRGVNVKAGDLDFFSLRKMFYRESVLLREFEK